MNAKSERASLPDRVEAVPSMKLTSDTLGPQYLAFNIRRDENTYETIVKLHSDGRVEVATWATVDDAAREFWDAVLRLNPLLAAADACEASRTSDDGHEAEASMSDHRIAAEAERNPNTTDKALEVVDGWVTCDVEPTPHKFFASSHPCENPRPVYALRRPVSSEDVHREERT